MLYKKNMEAALSKELFQNPTSEYRGTPFWAWNCELDRDELLRQIDIFREMGLGGFHMHVRTGMDTPYLSKEFFALIRSCVDHAKENQMLAWLYDEDRWPSGAAGGFVTKDPAFRQRYLMLTETSYGEKKSLEKLNTSSAAATRTENGRLLARYDVVLDGAGCLASYRRLADGEAATGKELFAYLETANERPWYNGQTYVNTLDKKAIERFIEITHEAYLREVGDEFGKTVPAIFTDEPQFTRKTLLAYPEKKQDVYLPYTDDLEDTYRATYGDSLLDRLPELIWELPSGVSVTRYRYHDHIAERFASAFADTCGTWCEKNGIALTGHMMSEPSLASQCSSLGEAMRSYRSFTLPGIDMLCAHFELTTAKQAQSAVHQFGREGMMSELYGVTGWDFDFRGHKLHGDWQAALGVTVRVQHLSWVSMKGEAKRDYPASISYQSPWYEKYRYVEDHFARVNTALTRGKPDVRIGLIHPIESYWLHWGPAEQTALVREEMDERFLSITKWLLYGSLDFNYISESLLPSLAPIGGAPLRVGEMAYDVILVPACETLRASTLERLEAFADAGGKLIFLGDAPTLVDALPSDRARRLYERSTRISFTRGALLSALEPYRSVELRTAGGSLTGNLLHQLRADGDGKWLFIAHGTEPYNKDVPNGEHIRIRVKGRYAPTEYDTVTGKIKPLSCRFVGEFTELEKTLYDYDSLLLHLEPAAEPATYPLPALGKGTSLPLAPLAEVGLGEPNVLLLDRAEYSFDGGEWQPETELLRADTACRISLGWCDEETAAAFRGEPLQPWVIEKKPPEHRITLRFTFSSALPFRATSLALEDASLATVTLNGEAVDCTPVGYYVDRAIECIPLPELKVGENVLLISLPFGERIGPEWCYLLGDFGVDLSGTVKALVARKREIGYDDITRHGYPFYGGTFTYRTRFRSEGGELALTVPHYRGAVMTVLIDGKECGELAYPPYTLPLGRVGAGEHTLEIRLYVSRQNAFGQLHNADGRLAWIGPKAWRSAGSSWTEEYRLSPEGILSRPILTEYR